MTPASAIAVASALAEVEPVDTPTVLSFRPARSVMPLAVSTSTVTASV